MINILELFGRILISTLFLVNGLSKINNYENTIIWMESFNLPGFFLVPAIVLEIVAPIFVIIGFKTKVAAASISLFCLATAIIFHSDFSDQAQLTAFLKNIALSGGFIFLVVNGPKGFSLDKK